MNGNCMYTAWGSLECKVNTNQTSSKLLEKFAQQKCVMVDNKANDIDCNKSCITLNATGKKSYYPATKKCVCNSPVGCDDPYDGL